MALNDKLIDNAASKFYIVCENNRLCAHNEMSVLGSLSYWIQGDVVTHLGVISEHMSQIEIMSTSCGIAFWGMS